MPGVRRPGCNDEDHNWRPPEKKGVVASGDESECERCSVVRGRRGMSECDR